MCVGWWTPGLSKQECRLVKLVTHQTPRRELWHFALAGEVCFKWKKCDFCYCTLVLVKNVQNVIFRSEFEKLSAVVVVLSEFMMRDLCEIAKIAECFLFSYPARKWTLEESTCSHLSHTSWNYYSETRVADWNILCRIEFQILQVGYNVPFLSLHSVLWYFANKEVWNLRKLSNVILECSL